MSNEEMKAKGAKQHTSKILNKFFTENNNLEYKKHSFKMIIASRIDDALKLKRMRKNELALLMNKSSSEVSKWLSGNQNFTIETLIEIEHFLGIEILNPKINYCNPCINKISPILSTIY